jgi:hypothetical protein
VITRRSFLTRVASIPTIGLLGRLSGAATDSWNVHDFGAKGDGQTLDTNAVQAAIDACTTAGGGLVHFPTGGNFLVGTIYLKSHVTLYVETNARITGSPDMRHYATNTGLNPYYPEPLDRCLVYAKGATDIGITGNGNILGHGPEPYIPIADATGREATQRPMLIRLENCDRIRITDVSLGRCGSWCIHLRNSSNFSLQNLHIDNERQDGVDIDSCHDGLIADCRMECGDDCIALMTSSPDKPVRNLSIHNCQLRSRWAGIRFGPASKGNFENIIVSDCILSNCNGGGIKLGMFEGAEIRDCIFTNIVMDRVTAPILILVATWPDIGSTAPNPPMMGVGKIHDLQFRGVRATTPMTAPSTRPDQNTSMFLHGHPNSAIENVTLTDIDITFAGGGLAQDAGRRNLIDVDQIDYRKGGYWTDDKSLWGIPPAYGLYARHVKGVDLSNVSFSLADRDLRSPLLFFDSGRLSVSQFKAECASGVPMITAVDCSDVTLSNLQPQTRTTLLRLEGTKSKDVTMFNNNDRQYTKLFECANGAPADAVVSK